MPRVNTEQDFWNRIKRGADDKCWPWLGPVSDRGYGKTTWKNKSRRAHTLAFEFKNGFCPVAVLHTCDNPPCCNPRHLFAGTNGINNTDRMQKGRNGDVSNERHYACKITNDQIAAIRALKGKLPIARVADMFGISRTYVYNLWDPTETRRRRGVGKISS